MLGGWRATATVGVTVAVGDDDGVSVSVKDLAHVRIRSREARWFSYGVERVEYFLGNVWARGGGAGGR